MTPRLILALLAACSAASLDAAPLGSAFTYQGSLERAGVLANGDYDFEVGLFNVASGGSQIALNRQLNLPVVDGVFTIVLDWTDAPYQDGEALFLELRIRPGDVSGPFTPLSPRQPLLAVPYAQQALSAPANARSASAVGRPVHQETSIFLGAGRIAGDSSVVTGSDGLPFIAVHDSANGDLLAVHCRDITCETRTITPIDTVNQVGANPSVLIDRTDRPVIAYHDATNGHLRVAFCANVACTNAGLVVADASGDVGQEVFAIYDPSSATTHFLYYDAGNGDLKRIFCTTGACTAPAVIDGSAADVGRGVSAAYSGSRLYVVYHNQTNGQLQLKVCPAGPGTCAPATTRIVDATADSGDATAIVVPPDGLPLILYTRSGTIRAARCATHACTSVVLTANPVANGTGIAAIIGADGMPFVFGINVQGTVTSRSRDRCGSYDCSSVIDVSSGGPPGSTDARPGIAFGGHGLPHISHRQGNNLTLITCGGNDCYYPSRR